jgi:hypothetical protein
MAATLERQVGGWARVKVTRLAGPHHTTAAAQSNSGSREMHDSTANPP